MAEPYVPIASLTSNDTLLTALEVTTSGAQTSANALNTAAVSALSSKTTAESALANKFNILVFVGA
jgi:hypothetical protein